MNGHPLDAGDGVAVEAEPAVSVTAKTAGAEVLLFDLP
jgi:hypothetical protein